MNEPEVGGMRQEKVLKAAWPPCAADTVCLRLRANPTSQAFIAGRGC